jgi:hypothetical protein
LKANYANRVRMQFWQVATDLPELRI